MEPTVQRKAKIMRFSPSAKFCLLLFMGLIGGAVILAKQAARGLVHLALSFGTQMHVVVSRRTRLLGGGVGFLHKKKLTQINKNARK
jgi:hypothetical protein